MEKQSETEQTNAFEGIGGNYSAIEFAKQFVLNKKNQERLAEYGLQISNGMLLYGPPGTGKTITARAIGADIGKPLYETSLSSLLGKYAGESEEKIASFMDKQDSVIFFNDMDSLAVNFAGGMIVTKMDGSSKKSNLYLAESNDPYSLDPKLLRAGRFDTALYFGIPDKEEIQDILGKQLDKARNRSSLTKKGIDIFKDVQIEAVADQMYSKSKEFESKGIVPIVGADVNSILRSAMSPVMKDLLNGKQRLPGTGDFLKAIDSYNKSLLWNKAYEKMGE